MNSTQAQAIVTLHSELMAHFPKENVTVPEGFTRENFYEAYVEDGRFVIKWSKYIGCGDYERDTTYENVEDVFLD